MEAARATSVGGSRARFGSGVGFAPSSLALSDARRTSPRRLPFLRPSWPAPLRAQSIVRAANSPLQQQLGVEGEEATGGAMEPERGSPRESHMWHLPLYGPDGLVHRLGRGAVYLGSSRVPASHPHYHQTDELAREIARMLDCTTWTGAGPGLMDAAIQGALEAERPVGGFKIGKEAGEWTTSNHHPYLPPESYLTCRFFSARKHGLVDATVRNSPADRTAVVALPGGIGTLDEVFEIMALIQLQRIGSALPVPFLLINYDSYYSKLLEFLKDCEDWGTVAPGEVASLWKVCSGNQEALEYLAEFYDVPAGKRNYRLSPQLEEHGTSYTASFCAP